MPVSQDRDHQRKEKLSAQPWTSLQPGVSQVKRVYTSAGEMKQAFQCVESVRALMRVIKDPRAARCMQSQRTQLNRLQLRHRAGKVFRDIERAFGGELTPSGLRP